MTEKRFKVNADYLNNLDSIIDNETGIEHDYLEIEELLNGLNDENEQSKMMIATLRNIVLENEDLEKENKELKKQLTLAKPLYSRRELEKENKELKAFKEKVFEWIDGEIDSVKESCTVLMTSDEAEAVMDTLIELKNELSGGKND